MTKNERIKYIRKELGLTLKEFSSRIGVTYSAVSYVENGDRNLSNQMATSICNVYNVNPEWLENGTGEMFVHKTRDQQFFDAVAEIDFQGNEIVKQIIISYANLSEEKQKVFLDFVHEVYEKAMQQKKSTGE